MNTLRVGLAMTGSFCTFEKALSAFERLQGSYDLTPIMSDITYGTDTRFGRAADHRARFHALCGKEIIHTIPEAEPIGPKHLIDVLLIAPCTGNTLAKLARGVTDTAVTMAAKSHLRCDRPVLLAVSTNDGLSGSAGSIAALLNRKNVYFVPFTQDDPVTKPHSLAADYAQLEAAIEAAARSRQLQPVLARHLGE